MFRALSIQSSTVDVSVGVAINDLLHFTQARPSVSITLELFSESLIYIRGLADVRIAMITF